MRTESTSVYWEWFRERSSDLYDSLSNAITGLFLAIRGMTATWSRPEGVRFPTRSVTALKVEDSSIDQPTEATDCSAVKMPSDAEQIKKDLNTLNEDWKKKSIDGVRVASFANAFGQTRPAGEVEWFKQECLALLGQKKIERDLVHQIALNLPGDSMSFTTQISRIN